VWAFKWVAAKCGTAFQISTMGFFTYHFLITQRMETQRIYTLIVNNSCKIAK
jgi:hypothetical protein